MKRLLVMLFLSASLAMAVEKPVEEVPRERSEPVKESHVGWRTMVIAAALILSPLFAGWALGKRGSKR